MLRLAGWKLGPFQTYSKPCLAEAPWNQQWPDAWWIIGVAARTDDGAATDPDDATDAANTADAADTADVANTADAANIADAATTADVANDYLPHCRLPLCRRNFTLVVTVMLTLVT